MSVVNNPLTKADLRRIRTAALVHWRHNGGVIGIPANINSAQPASLNCAGRRGAEIELPCASAATVSEPVHVPANALPGNSFHREDECAQQWDRSGSAG